MTNVYEVLFPMLTGILGVIVIILIKITLDWNKTIKKYIKETDEYKLACLRESNIQNLNTERFRSHTQTQLEGLEKSHERLKKVVYDHGEKLTLHQIEINKLKK